jgi:hypothetical protein
LLAGVALGLGVGSKDTALLPAIGVLVLLVWLLPRAKPVRGVALTVGGTLVLSAFWWLRNWVVIGNPIYPQGVTVGSHHLLTGASSPLTAYSTTLLDHLLHGRFGPLHRWELLARSLIGPLALVALVGIVAPIASARRRPRRLALLLVGGLAGATFVAYLLTPYTGGGVPGLTFLISSQLRYMLPALLIGAAAAAAAMPRMSAVLAIAALVYDAQKDLGSGGLRPDLQVRYGTELLAAGIAIVVFAAPAVVPRLRELRWLRVSPVPVGALLMSALIVGGVAVASERYASPTGAATIDQALARSGEPAGPVMAVGVGDVSSLVGARLKNRVVSPVDGALAGSGADLSAADLSQAVARSHPGAVVVGHAAYGAVPPSWTPPGYVRAGSIAAGTVFVATTLPTQPAVPALPNTPSTTVPPTPVPPATTIPTVPKAP